MPSSTFALGTGSLLTQALSVASLTTTIINKDVIMIGGGAGGAHAAVRLMRDTGQDIVFIEQQFNVYVGRAAHVDSYTDPTTNTPYDYGVASYADYGNATAFVESLGIEPVTPAILSPTLDCVDFTTEHPVEFVWPTTWANNEIILLKILAAM